VCGSLSGYKSWKDIHDLYSLSIASELLKEVDPQPAAVVRPTDQRPFIRMAGGKRGLDLGTWGFPPPEGRSNPIINARCETVDVLPTFAKAFEKHRCVIPVTGYYEWKKEIDGSRTPWRFSLDGPANNGGAVSQRIAARNRMFEGEGGSLFVLAGIFMVNRKTGQRDFAIVTTEPSEIAAEIHDRMPVILTDSMMDLWLTPYTAPQALKRMCRPYEGGNLVAQPVSKTLHQPPKDVDENQMSLGV
jgi:putative SOS response-associated peptidase YedK